ncbi:hypothetical protein U9M48_036550 [Paspalum notatum var. saurae]|uniref:DNA-directed RNA polymerase III subunit RPC9 n=1 Tax=Paspalum notatum var. saurae TaxID=547442 RepID=A0AAQ3UHG2_PASNO
MKISDLTCASGVAVDPWVQPGFLGFSIPYDDQRANLLQKANAGVLTNFEVLDFLQSRGAKIDPMGCLGAVAASECKVYEYLLKTPACNQTRESIFEFVKRSEGFRLAEADKLNVINWRPSSAADAYAMIEECGKRFSRDERGEACDEDVRVLEFLDIVKEVLPPPPPKAEADVEAEAEVEAKITQE